MRLELGAGLRPTRGYVHHDAQPFPHIEYHDDPWMLDLPDESCDEIFALAFIEHLTYDQARDTFRNVHRMLRPGGVFLFDVPDFPAWCRYYLACIGEGFSPLPLVDIRRTMFGWQRWPGDEHKSGWDRRLIVGELEHVGFSVTFGVESFAARTWRSRFTQPLDAHLYVQAVR